MFYFLLNRAAYLDGHYLYRNFLDCDTLGGLTVAIRDWVVIISHNEEFVGAPCKALLAASATLD